MASKSIFTSKTFWVQVLGVAALVVPGAEHGQQVGGVVAGLDRESRAGIGLRLALALFWPFRRLLSSLVHLLS